MFREHRETCNSESWMTKLVKQEAYKLEVKGGTNEQNEYVLDQLKLELDKYRTENKKYILDYQGQPTLAILLEDLIYETMRYCA